MQKKAQMGEIGGLLVIFLTVMVGLILFVAGAQEIGKSTNTNSVNITFTAPTNLTAYYFNDYKNFDSVTVYNYTGQVLLASGNYTITNNFINPTTGALSVRLIPSADYPAYAGRSWSLYATAQPLGYISDSAGRSIAGLIMIFFALGIAIVVLVPTLRNGIIDLVS